MKKVLILFLFLTLTGCSAKHQFDCPYKEGARCLSVGEIDKKIDAGEIGRDGAVFESKTAKLKTKQKGCSFFSCKKPSFEESYPLPSPLRTQESVLRLWIAPFYSQDGIYHEGHHLHFVAQDATWKNINPEIGEENP